jgi:hypothetical protein
VHGPLPEVRVVALAIVEFEVALKEIHASMYDHGHRSLIYGESFSKFLFAVGVTQRCIMFSCC